MSGMIIKNTGNNYLQCAQIQLRFHCLIIARGKKIYELLQAVEQVEGGTNSSKAVVLKTKRNTQRSQSKGYQSLPELAAAWARAQVALNCVVWLQGQCRAGRGQCGLRPWRQIQSVTRPGP